MCLCLFGAVLRELRAKLSFPILLPGFLVPQARNSGYRRSYNLFNDSFDSFFQQTLISGKNRVKTLIFAELFMLYLFSIFLPATVLCTVTLDCKSELKRNARSKLR